MRIVRNVSSRIVHHEIAADSFAHRRFVSIHANAVHRDRFRFVRPQRDVLAVWNHVILIFSAARFQNHRWNRAVDRLITEIVDPHISDVADRFTGADYCDRHAVTGEANVGSAGRLPWHHALPAIFRVFFLLRGFLEVV